MGRIKEAVQLHEETLKLRKSVLEPEHPDIFHSMEGLAFSLHMLGQRHEANQLYENILTMRRRVLGEDHPDTVRVVQYLTSITEMTQTARQ